MSEATAGGCFCFAGNAAFLAVTGLWQMAAQVDQPRDQPLTRGVDCVFNLTGIGSATECRDAAICHKDIGDLICLSLRIDYPRIRNMQISHQAGSSLFTGVCWPLMAIAITAIRTAMP